MASRQYRRDTATHHNVLFTRTNPQGAPKKPDELKQNRRKMANFTESEEQIFLDAFGKSMYTSEARYLAEMAMAGILFAANKS